MGFLEAVKSGFVRVLDFNSRSSRSEFWWFQLFILLLMFLLLWMDVPYVLMDMMLVMLLPLTLALEVRRLHDIDRSGWWCLLAFVPFGPFVLLYWAVTRGTYGKNQFGTDPLNPDLDFVVPETEFQAFDEAITTALIKQDLVKSFVDAYEKTDAATCEAILGTLNLSDANIERYIGFIRDEGCVPRVIVDARKA
ncbi:DUF805 domain-containing protein [Kordiimonas aquimaris]|uniref:DUF805 domain-containing protein n=1 Tax=Kordiimonas aquimaris TaxID=707591 RepID=UPI0021D3C73F|nr:DUF805 domain-containing protein [Kordiimonas aquimaris]